MSVPRQMLTPKNTLTCRGGGRFFSPHSYNRVPQGVRGNSLASAAPTNKPMPQQTENFAQRWNVIANPGAEPPNRHSRILSAAPAGGARC